MSTIVNCSRRNFLKSSALAGGGLILGVHIPGLNGSAKAAAAAQENSMFVPNAFLRIAKDGSVTVIGNHSEMGQGSYTSGAMTIAEELDADWTRIRVEPAPVDPAYNHLVYGVQITGGSTSTWSEWDRLRKAGAAARQMLLTAAAQTWNVDPSTCRTENGYVIHADLQRERSHSGAYATGSEPEVSKPHPRNERKDDNEQNSSSDTANLVHNRREQRLRSPHDRTTSCARRPRRRDRPQDGRDE